MKKINIAEILKNSPKGTMLYSTVHGYVELIDIHRDVIRCKPDYLNTIISFYSDGRWVVNRGECILFPSKENRDWSTFKLPFKDGDILYINYGDSFKYIAIFKQIISNTVYVHTYYKYINNSLNIVNKVLGPANADIRFATEEEKQELFKVIEDKGYKWNPETKILEKLPKFNDGDIIFEDRFHSICIFKREGSIKGTIDYYCGISSGEFYVKDEKNIDEHFGDISDYRLATKEERQKLFDAIKANGHKWNDETKTLEKLIGTKFKVGDWIEFKYYERKPEKVIRIENNVYWLSSGRTIMFQDESAWDLATKFDLSTLKPFEEVLVRYGNLSEWSTGIFSHTVKSDNKLYFIVNTQHWEQCIPYKGNEHLRGKTDACSDYFKTWEE